MHSFPRVGEVWPSPAHPLWLHDSSSTTHHSSHSCEQVEVADSFLMHPCRRPGGVTGPQGTPWPESRRSWRRETWNHTPTTISQPGTLAVHALRLTLVPPCRHIPSPPAKPIHILPFSLENKVLRPLFVPVAGDLVTKSVNPELWARQPTWWSSTTALRHGF